MNPVLSALIPKLRIELVHVDVTVQVLLSFCFLITSVLFFTFVSLMECVDVIISV